MDFLCVFGPFRFSIFRTEVTHVRYGRYAPYNLSRIKLNNFTVCVSKPNIYNTKSENVQTSLMSLMNLMIS